MIRIDDVKISDKVINTKGTFKIEVQVTEVFPTWNHMGGHTWGSFLNMTWGKLKNNLRRIK